MTRSNEALPARDTDTRLVLNTLREKVDESYYSGQFVPGVGFLDAGVNLVSLGSPARVAAIEYPTGTNNWTVCTRVLKEWGKGHLEFKVVYTSSSADPDTIEFRITLIGMELDDDLLNGTTVGTVDMSLTAPPATFQRMEATYVMPSINGEYEDFQCRFIRRPSSHTGTFAVVRIDWEFVPELQEDFS